MKFRNDQHTMFPTMLDSCELNNVFSTNFLNYIHTTQRAMLSLWGGLQNGRAVNQGGAFLKSVSIYESNSLKSISKKFSRIALNSTCNLFIKIIIDF